MRGGTSRLSTSMLFSYLRKPWDKRTEGGSFQRQILLEDWGGGYWRFRYNLELLS